MMSELLTQPPPPPREGNLELAVYMRQQSRVYGLTLGSVLEIGRAVESQIRLDDPSVSRNHARLYVGSEIEIEDLGSANGTTLVRAPSLEDSRDDTGSDAHTPLEPNRRTPLQPGDVLRIGAVIVVLQRKGRSSLSELKPMEAVTSGAPVLVDPEMRRAHDLVARAAASDISVLILGETGVGKEVTAEALHRASPRAEGPFLRLNCAALPESLLESELFGHERGAFTGAHATKMGLLEATDGGTVFLDEIGELPMGTQAKLLRVLEERMVTRVGSTKPKRIDVRFVTATNRDLSKDVRNSRFRGDLYYRISGLVVRLPALRHRPSELEPLARHFLREFCARSGQPVPELLEPSLLRLKSHDWPGNVRELKNVMERAALLANHGVITEQEILLENANFEPELADVDDFDSDTAVFNVPATGLGGTTERDRIVRALELCGGNQTRAAKMLGVSRRTLINRLEQFNLPRPKKQ
jgi:two-component system, NtrC family, response regulator AtoC